jgi:hypothetical protein
VASCACCLRRKLDGGLKRTCRLVAQLSFTWRSHGALADHSELGGLGRMIPSLLSEEIAGSMRNALRSGPVASVRRRHGTLAEYYVP